MMESVIVMFSFCLTAVLSQDQLCGPSSLFGSSGWFSSPSYPLYYPHEIRCQWMIRGQEDNSVLIKLIGFQDIGNDDGAIAGRNYLRAFDANDESTFTYLGQSKTMDLNRKFPTFLSKSNHVIVQFVTDGQPKLIRFNATYESVRKNDFCDRNQLLLDPNINGAQIKCQTEGMTGHFKSCQVTCAGGYRMKADGKVLCETGKFTPENPCVPIDLEVKLCLLTGMEHCIYTLDELTNYLKRQDGEGGSDDQSKIPNDDHDISRLLPRLDDVVTPITTSSLNKDINMERRVVDPAARIQDICFDKYHRTSYCSKNGNKQYAFSCYDYRRIPRIQAAYLTKTCNICRNLGCTNLIYM